MGTHRDHELGSALLDLPVPGHREGFWEELEQRLQDEPAPRRPRRPSPGLWLLAVAAAALVVSAVAVLDDPSDTRVTVSTPATGPEEPASAGLREDAEFPGIYPATDRGELTRHLEAIADGDTSSPLDLEGVVRDYLANRGVTAPALEPFEGGGGAAVRYTPEGQRWSGTVRLVRVAEGAYLVNSATTELIQTLEVRRDGDRLVLTVDPAVPGEITARVAAPPKNGGVHQRTARGSPGTPTEIVLDHPAPGAAAVVRVEISAPGSGRGFAEVRVAPRAPASGDGLGPTSPLTADGIGPVKIGMTPTAAERAAGTPLALRLGPYCDELLPPDLPGVTLVRKVPGAAVELVFVASEAIRTSAGVGVGSSADDVVGAHGEPTRRGPEGAVEWLYYAGPAGDAGPGLRFELNDGRVVSMVAGLGVLAEEHCA